MLSSYKKIKGDSRIKRQKIEDISFPYRKQFHTNTIVLYLHISPSNYFYLLCK